MSHLVTVDKTDFPGHDVMNMYFLDLAAVARAKLKDCFTIRQLTWQIFHSVPDQFSIIYFVSDTYQQKNIKNAERLFRGNSQRYILKSLDIKLPADMQSFLRNAANKEMLFYLIQVAPKEGNKKIGDKVIYFSNINHCLKITQHEAFTVPEKSNDHEEADAKLVALVEAAYIANRKTVMIRSPSGDIDIILFILHEFDRITILIDNDVGKSRKIIDMSTSLLCQQKQKALAAVHVFSENDYVSSFFWEGKNAMWKLVLQNDKFLDAFSQLGFFNSVNDEVSTCLEKFVCALYGYKNERSSKNVPGERNQ